MKSCRANKGVICRLCLNESDSEMHQLHWKGDIVDESLVEQIEQCGGIQLFAGSVLPDSICERCFALLQGAHKFRTLCQQSQEQLVAFICSSLPKKHFIIASRKVNDVSQTRKDNSNAIVTELFNAGKSTSPSKRVLDGKSSPSSVEHPHEMADKQTYVLCTSEDSEDLLIDNEEFLEIENAHINFIEDDSSQNALSLEMENYPSDEQEIEKEHSMEQLHGIHGVLNDDEDEVNTMEEDAEEGEEEGEENDVEAEDEQEQYANHEINSKIQIVPMKTSTKIQSKEHGNDGATTSKSYKIVTSDSKSDVKRKRKRRGECADTAVEEDQSFICCYCGNIYNEKSKLTLHMKSHTKEKPHECEICHKRFAQTPQLARHMNSHTGTRPYKCKYCDSCFADPSTRVKHQRIHTNERPYKCNICSKSFSYSNVLKVHLITHTGDKPYACEHCGRKFSQLHHKKSHERIHKNSNSKLIPIGDDYIDV